MEKINVKEYECCGCSACVKTCPKHCISLKRNAEGFLYPKIEETECIKCSLCVKVCPFQFTGSLRVNKPDTYAVKILDSHILEESSSGGIFSALAEEILREKGSVYGAAMSNDMKSVHHIRISSIDNIELLRGSKYLQSEMDDCFELVRQDLEKKRKVLFSGVPCQINGLKLYLNKTEYENLFCIEVLCHGVPSTLLWQKYVDYIETKYKTKVTSVNFRNKKYGWRKFGLFMEGNPTSRYNSLEKDTYLQMFLKNYCLRQSCYACKVKKYESMADISIADFWGVENIVPEIFDDKGTSLVLVQTNKGMVLFKKIQNLISYRKIDFKDGIRDNSAYYKSAYKPKERDIFFKELNTYGYEYVSKKYGHLTMKEYVLKLIGNTPILAIYKKVCMYIKAK